MTGSHGDSSTSAPAVRELPKITIQSDTRDVLAHAAKAASKLDDYFIVDIDAHVTESAFWSDITDRIDNDYLPPRRASRSRKSGGRRRA